MGWNCRTWEAWHDRMPGKEPTLHVSGECEMPTPGYTLELRYKDPQGTNPRNLLLTLHIVGEPEGPQPEVLTWTPVTFALKTESQYETVTIIGVASAIPVRQVS
jgi:hypothetical protein